MRCLSTPTLPVFLTTQELATALGIQARSILVQRCLTPGKTYRGLTPIKEANRLLWPADSVARIRAREAAIRAQYE